MSEHERDDLWPVEDIAHLRRWWGRRSATEIGNDLKRSKNSVVGKAFRLGLRGGQRSQQPQPKWPPKLRAPRPPKSMEYVMRKKVQPPKVMPEDIWQPLPGTTPIMLVDLEPDDCRWPVGAGFCGCFADLGSYCATHRAIAWAGAPGVKPLTAPRSDAR
jgi:hypothetical protein